MPENLPVSVSPSTPRVSRRDRVTLPLFLASDERAPMRTRSLLDAPWAFPSKHRAVRPQTTPMNPSTDPEHDRVPFGAPTSVDAARLATAISFSPRSAVRTKRGSRRSAIRATPSSQRRTRSWTRASPGSLGGVRAGACSRVVPERVPHAVNRSDEARLGPVLLELATDASHMRIDDASARVVAIPPHAVHQLLAREHDARITGEGDQDPNSSGVSRPRRSPEGRRRCTSIVRPLCSIGPVAFWDRMCSIRRRIARTLTASSRRLKGFVR